MAHPFSGHKAMHVGKRRVKVLMRSGGYAHSDEKADKKLFSKLIAEHEGHEPEHGGEYARGGRLDKFARGGRTKKPHVNINIIHHSRSAPPPGGAVGMGAGAGPPPPIGAPPGPLLPPGAGVPPPGMKRGGRAHRDVGGDVPPLGIGESQGSIMDRAQAARERGDNPNYRSLMQRATRMSLPEKKASGGFISGISTKENIDKWKGYARKNTKVTRADGGRIGTMRKGKKYGEGSGEGRLEEFHHMKGR